jgi:hypothetical protein
VIDTVGAVFGTAVYAVLVGILVGFSPERVSTKLVALTAVATWGGLIIALAALGAFAPGTTGPVPAPVLAFVVFLVLLFGGWVGLPRFRSALLSVPLSALVAVNAARLGGIFFLMLAAEGRLSAPFAPVAGTGDMTVGVLAIPLAVAATAAAGSRPWLGAWNALGVVDLIVAVSLGALSAPGTPFRVFTEGPGILAMTTLPWIMVPAMLVPLYFLIHFTIAVKLRSLRRTPQAVPGARAAA